MLTSYRWRCTAIAAGFILATILTPILSTAVWAQTAGNSGSINGSAIDPTGAVVANATVEIHNPVSGFDRSTVSDAAGKFAFTNIPFNNYHMTVKAAGFATYSQDVEARSAADGQSSYTTRLG